MIKNLVIQQPWVIFLVLGLIAQQGNMLSYKLGGEAAIPYVFLTYSFTFQAILNLGLTLFFKNRNFPIVFNSTVFGSIICVAIIYILNEMLFVSIYRYGAPYALATAIFSVSSLVLVILAGVSLFKEKLNRFQCIGLVFALIAIVLIKVG